MLVPKLRFKEFNDEYILFDFNDIASYKKGPFGSALKKEIFVPKSDTSIKVYEQQNAIKKDWTLKRYFITNEYFKKLKGFDVRPTDIIVSCAGTIGKLYVLPSNAEIGIINQALMRIRINNEVVNQRYFTYIFNNMLEHFSKTFSNGSAIKNIPPFADLKKQPAKLPSVIEQNKIANFLSLLDKKIELQSKKIEILKLYKSYQLCHIFKSDDLLEYFLKDLAVIKKGQQINSDKLLSNGNYYMLNGGITLSGYLNKYNTTKNTISISEGGNSCGYVNYNYKNFWSGGHCYTLTPININSEYLYHLLKNSEKLIMKLRIGTGLPNIQKKDLENFMIKTHNDIKIQEAIANTFMSFDLKIKLEKDKLSLLENMKKGYMKNMFV
ncbi:MAG: restriction endonuclease subunit S [Bacilli bacterium]